MPNRILKESIRTSKSVNAMTDFQFRLWAYLITYVDDFGRGSADPELLKGFVFPRRKGVTEATIEKTLCELASLGSIRLYDVDGESYLVFPGWEKHQQPRAKVSKFPEPPADASTCKQMQADESRCKQMQADAPDTRYTIHDNDTRYTGTSNARAARFTPPTVEQVAEYAKEKGYAGFNADRFCDFYASKGWKVGKDTMKDWQAAVRGWAARDKENAPRNQITTYIDVDWDKIGL